MKKKSNYIRLILGIILLVAGFIMIKEQWFVDSGVPYIFLGFGCGIFGNGVDDLARGWSRKKDPAAAKREAIEIKDERNIQIRNMAKAKGFDLMNFTLIPLTIAFGLMKESFRVILPLIVLYLLVDFYAIYWMGKLGKQM